MKDDDDLPRLRDNPWINWHAWAVIAVAALGLILCLGWARNHQQATAAPAAPAVKVHGTITASESGGQIYIDAEGWPNSSTLTVILEDHGQVTYYKALPTGSGSFTHAFLCGYQFKASVGSFGIDESNVHPNCNGGSSPSTTSIPPSSTSAPTTPTTGSSVAPTTSTSTPSTSVPATVATPTSSATTVASTAPPVVSSSSSTPPADGPPPTGLVIPPTK